MEQEAVRNCFHLSKFGLNNFIFGWSTLGFLLMLVSNFIYYNLFFIHTHTQT